MHSVYSLILFYPEFVGAVIEAFVKLHDKGLIYQGKLLYILAFVVVAVSTDVLYSYEVW